MVSNFKVKRIRDQKHLAFIRTLPCVLCGKSPSEAAHIRTATNSGTGIKPNDSQVISACQQCHALAHLKGHKTVFGDTEKLLNLANVLWIKTGDFDYCVSSIMRFKKCSSS